MEKTIRIDNKDIQFKVNGATPLRYKAQFGKDYFAEILKLNKLANFKGENFEALENADFEVFYNLAWTFAKTADKNIPDPLTWLDEFEEFPVFDIMPEIQDLLISSIQTKKK